MSDVSTLVTVLGRHLPQPRGPCSHVLVLSPALRLAAVSDQRLVVIDYYYYATAGGKKIWVRLDTTPLSNVLSLTVEAIQWKKYLTTMQITQFVIDLFAVYFGSKCRQ